MRESWKSITVYTKIIRDTNKIDLKVNRFQLWDYEIVFDLYYHKNKIHFGIYYNRKQLFELVLLYFDQIKAALVSIND